VTGLADLVPEFAALNTQWSAIGGTSLKNARENTGITAAGDVPVFRLDDQDVVNDAFDLWGAGAVPLLNPVQINETGVLETSTRIVFTGLSSNGTSSVNPLGGANVDFGRAGNVNQTWTRANNLPATELHRFYAISDVLTVPDTVPALTTPGLVAMTLLLVAAAVVCVGDRK
jgi:hypothetical protein